MPVDNITELSGVNVSGLGSTSFNFTLLDDVNIINGHPLAAAAALSSTNQFIYYSFQNLETNTNANGWDPNASGTNYYANAEIYWGSTIQIQGATFGDITFGWFGGWNNNPNDIVTDNGNGRKWRSGQRSSFSALGDGPNLLTLSNAGGINAKRDGATTSLATGPNKNAAGTTLNFTQASDYYNASANTPGGITIGGPFSIPYFGGYADGAAPDNIPQESTTGDGYLFSEKSVSANRSRFQVVRTPEYRFQRTDTVKYVGFAYHAYGSAPGQGGGGAVPGNTTQEDYSIPTMANNLRYSIGGEIKEFIVGVYCSIHPDAHDENTNPDGVIPDGDRKAIFLGGPTVEDLSLFQHSSGQIDGRDTDYRMVYLRLPSSEALGLSLGGTNSLYFYLAFGPSSANTGYRGDVAVTNLAVVEMTESEEEQNYGFAKYWANTHQGNLWENHTNVYTQENIANPVVGVYH